MPLTRHRTWVLGTILPVLGVVTLLTHCSAGGGPTDKGEQVVSNGGTGDMSVGGAGDAPAFGGDPGVIVETGGCGNECGGTQGQFMAECGDSVVTPDAMEECDDGNKDALDGCSDKCKLEAGWRCPFPGLKCEAAMCGDAILAGNEKCDFTTATVGCDATTCQFTAGYACDAAACHETVCGDMVAEGAEPCDDGNSDWGDGCRPDCQPEPDCSGASCVSACGDGMILPGGTEACDDGNTLDGDGCSAMCAVEAGFTCDTATVTDAGMLTLPIVYRDMKKASLAGGHPDFGQATCGNSGLQTGMVETTLGTDGKPVLVSPANGVWQTTAVTFPTWYTDSEYGKTVLSTITLTETPAASGTFIFQDTSFFPLDGLGWASMDFGNDNFFFTSELHYWFQWAGGEVLTFNGDDDVWVFVNKKLAVDIGGIHQSVQGSVTLDDATNTSKGLGLVVGQVYEIALFQAERCEVLSNYGLTLKGFNIGRSTCVSMCGDAIVTPDELCDEGTDKNVGGYGHCAMDCKSRGGYCGDDTVQKDGGEACDDGNVENGDGCNSVCQREVVK